MTFKARPGKLNKTKPAKLHPGPDLDQTAHYNSIERRFGYKFTPRQVPTHEPVRSGPDQVIYDQIVHLQTANKHLRQALTAIAKIAHDCATGPKSTQHFWQIEALANEALDDSFT